MKKTLLLITGLLIFAGLTQSVLAQESTAANDTWYVWIDTEVPIDSKMVKIVSNGPMVITCCPKSAKYRKFVKKTAKWITENISEEYDGELSLMKIQDQDLANQTIAGLKEQEGVVIVDYIAVCK
ncbi:MAG: hypothetical protein DRI71_07585 [Bacteroidetes bacterium]|nr:MAG: hypothetical protein DRI71_07585 [Bacteroidota bacterium]